MKNKLIILSSIGVLLIGVALFAGYAINRPDTTTAHVNAVVTPQPPTVSELLKLVNEERTKVGVAPLKIDARLNKSAQQKADDMFTYDYFGHTSDKSPNSRGDSRQWLQASGIQCSDTSENISWGKDVNTSQSAINGWVNSKPHYKAMINPSYIYTGFGISGDKIVEHFCQP